MKRLLRIFELTANEQRVVLIIMLILITIAFVAYERRMHHSAVQPTAAVQAKRSPTPMLNGDRH
jgi:ABC-type Fe3+ transport system permease subunit